MKTYTEITKELSEGMTVVNNKQIGALKIAAQDAVSLLKLFKDMGHMVSQRNQLPIPMTAQEIKFIDKTIKDLEISVRNLR